MSRGKNGASEFNPCLFTGNANVKPGVIVGINVNLTSGDIQGPLATQLDLVQRFEIGQGAVGIQNEPSALPTFNAN